MANTILTSDILAREALLILENNLVMGNLVDRRYEGEFASGRQGDAIRIRRPASFTVNEFDNTGGTQQVSPNDPMAQFLNKDYRQVMKKVEEKAKTTRGV